MGYGDYLTPEEVAEMHGVSKSSIYAAIKEGRITTERIFNRQVIHRRVASAWGPKTGRITRARRAEMESTKNITA